MADKARTVLSVCNNMGEGRLLTAEMLDLIDHGAPNIGSVEKVGVEPDPKRVGPASWNLEYG